jgi:hypothetical protein
MTASGNTALFLASIRYLAGAPPSVLKSFIKVSLANGLISEDAAL